MLRYSILVLMSAAALFANGSNPDGPPIRRTGVQVDGGQFCTACHNNPFPNPNPDTLGSVRVQAVNYTPGQRQTLRVTVTHPEARRWGFQLTARLASDQTKKAGVFAVATTDENIQVRCDSDTAARGTPGPCTDAQVEFVQHRPPGTRLGANGTSTWEIPWTAPATDVGEVIFYVAGNAANDSGTNAGDRIFTFNTRIQAAGPAPAPAISQGGIITAAQFGASTTVAPGSWIEIYGTNLAGATQEWAGSDFTGSNAPTTLGGVRVLVGGTPAYVRFVSPGQINAQVPASDAVGPVTLRVETPGGNSERPVTMARTSPGLLAPANYKVGDRQFAAFFRGAEVTRTVRAGETVTLYGIGFGPTNPAVAPGVITGANANLATAMTVQFGTAPATVSFAGLPSGFVGLYQFNLTVPAGVSGDVRLNVTLGGTPIAQELWANVQ